MFNSVNTLNNYVVLKSSNLETESYAFYGRNFWDFKPKRLHLK